MVKSVRDSYNKICDKWSDFCEGRKVNKCIADFVGLLEPRCKILDAGCGTGYPIAAFLAEKGFRVTGIDISEEMIKRAESLNLTDACFFVEDISEFHSDEKYGAVIAFDSLWHIEYGKQEEIYKVIASVLEQGGKFIFTHGRTDGEVTGTMYGEKFYNSALDGEKVRRLLTENGFEILSFTEDYKEETTGNRDLLVIAEKK